MPREPLLLVHFIGLALTLGSAIVLTQFSLSDAKASPKALRKVSTLLHIGSVTQLVSGLILLMPYMSTLKSMPGMHVKLTLVVAMFALAGISTKKLRVGSEGDGDEAIFKKGQLLNRINGIIMLLMIGAAVITFN